MADVNYYNIADQTGVTLKDVTIDPRTEGIDPSTIDDVLKLSRAQNILIETVTVNAGGLQKENAVDMNRLCVDVVMKDCILYAGKQNAITIKGGCRDIIIENVQIVPGTGHCDIELGNYSQQSTAKTINVTLNNVTRTDGNPVRLRVGNGNYPTIIDSNIDYLWFQSIILKIYMWYKTRFPNS